MLLLVLIEARTLDGGPGQWPASESTPEKKDLAGATKPLADPPEPTQAQPSRPKENGPAHFTPPPAQPSRNTKKEH